jgi:hypothetical protein
VDWSSAEREGSHKIDDHKATFEAHTCVGVGASVDEDQDQEGSCVEVEF